MRFLIYFYAGGCYVLNISARVSAIALCVAVLLSFDACGRNTPNTDSSSKTSSSLASATKASPAKVPENLSLPVTLDKSLDPLTTDSMNNLVLWPLMYDSLVEPDQNFAPVLGLASSVDNSGNIVTVHLKSSVTFSDSTPLTSKDVVYSYKQVMVTSTSFFASNVTNIDYVEPSGSSTVIFHLKTPDSMFSNLLDLPIIKYDSDLAQQNYPNTGINTPPIGSGIYTFSTNSFSGTLSYNKSWYKGGVPGFKAINLVNMLNGSATFSNLKIGEINCMLTDYGNGTVASAGLDTAPVYLNRMVFMGVNSANPALSDAVVRNAISLAIDRKTIVANAFSSRAAATVLPFNPNWTGLAKPDIKQFSPNYGLAQSELAKEGFAVMNSAGALSGSIDGTAVTLSFKLLVDKDDPVATTTSKEIIADLNKAGVVVALDAEPADVYSSMLLNNTYELYLGQINLTDNMDITPLLSAGGAVAGATQQGSTLSAFNDWRSGKANINSVANAFNDETPFIPICYRYGSVSHTKGLGGTFTPTYYDIFSGIESWHF